MAKKQRISLITLGCDKNTVDSEVVLAQLERDGFEISDSPGDADIAVINTCGFIEAAKKESIETILSAVELKRLGRLRRVVVMGCLSERYKKDLQREIPEVDVYVGANKMDRVLQALGVDLKYELLGERSLTTPRHFAYMKISEGCDNPCSFCAIPLMRGKHASRPLESLVREAESLAARGVRELILIAQDSSSYGVDLYGKRTLAGLLGRLGNVEGIEWLRLMYVYPASFPLDVLEQYGSNPKLCRYMDIPIQHIAGSVLRSMRRGMSSQATRRLLDTIRSAVPEIVLRTSVMVGYPNESETEFNELLDFVKEGYFDRLGVFTYSREDDTAAYPLGDPVAAEVKEERHDRIMEAQREVSLRKNQTFIDRQLKVLIDRCEELTAFGRTEFDAPEIDNEVVVAPRGSIREGELHSVTITHAEEYDLYAAPNIA